MKTNKPIPRGRKGGRRPALNDRQVERMLELYDAQMLTVDEIRKIFGICKMTFYKYVRGRENERN